MGQTGNKWQYSVYIEFSLSNVRDPAARKRLLAHQQIPRNSAADI